MGHNEWYSVPSIPYTIGIWVPHTIGGMGKGPIMGMAMVSYGHSIGTPYPLIGGIWGHGYLPMEGYGGPYPWI